MRVPVLFTALLLADQHFGRAVWQHKARYAVEIR